MRYLRKLWQWWKRTTHAELIYAYRNVTGTDRPLFRLGDTYVVLRPNDRIEVHLFRGDA